MKIFLVTIKFCFNLFFIPSVVCYVYNDISPLCFLLLVSLFSETFFLFKLFNRFFLMTFTATVTVTVQMESDESIIELVLDLHLDFNGCKVHEHILGKQKEMHMVWLLTKNMLNKNQYQTKKMYI